MSSVLPYHSTKIKPWQDWTMATVWWHMSLSEVAYISGFPFFGCAHWFFLYKLWNGSSHFRSASKRMEVFQATCLCWEWKQCLNIHVALNCLHKCSGVIVNNSHLISLKCLSLQGVWETCTQLILQLVYIAMAFLVICFILLFLKFLFIRYRGCQWNVWNASC